MTRQLRLFLVAIHFYSCIPVTGRLAAWMGWDDAWLGRATRYFPVVGLLVALGQSLVYVAASIVLPHPVAVLLALAAGLMLTGALHEDGFADFCDGCGGATDRRRTLAIMRDARVGAYGAIGVGTLLLLRFQTLAHVDTDWIVVTLLCAATFSRGCAALVMASLRDARNEDDARAQAVARHVSRLDTCLALAFAAAPGVALSLWIGDPTPAGIAASLALLATALMRRMMVRRIGGYRGDCLGAVQQVAEAAYLLGMLAMLDLHPVAEPEPALDPDETDEEP